MAKNSYTKIEEIEKEMPMSIQKALELYGTPVVLFRGDWVSKKFILTKVALIQDGVRVFGYFTNGGSQKEPGLKELRCIRCLYRAERYDPEVYK